ncbi:MAG: MaoC/PaaZ C-terminal domain-containing protein [Solirubrobacterales bacterium]
MSTVELKSAPGSGGLYLKAALGMTPLAGKRKKELPDKVLTLAPAPVDLDKLSGFCRVTEHTMTGTLPPVYFNVLAFPLHMAQLTSDGFPFPAIGLVHIENKIEQKRPVEASEPLGLAVRVQDLRPHAKGRQFDVISEARVGDEIVSVATSTYLRRGKSDDSVAAEPTLTADFDSLPATATWSLSSDLGRRYGAVSGDRNPIHMYGITAKALGFPTQIAHGMWSKARALAAVDNKLPGAFTVQVAFKQPILLPSKVTFGVAEREDGLDFAISNAKKGKPHLYGSTFNA